MMKDYYNTVFKTISMFILSFLIIINFSKCNNEDFSPFGDLVDGVAIHCILDNRLEYIIAKVQKVYIDNSVQDLSNYKVLLSEPFGNQIIMEDTTINSSPNTRYYKIKSSLLNRGSNYLLLLLESNNVISYASCKYHSRINWSEIDRIIEPPNGPIKWNVELRFPVVLPDVFLFKLFIKYQYQENGKTANSLIEVPSNATIKPSHPKYNEFLYIFEYDYNDITKVYPAIHSRSDSVNYQIKFRNTYYSIEYDGYNTQACLNSLSKHNSPITIKGMIAVFYTIDKNYYDFYMQPGNTSISVRLDQPEYYTNIESPKDLKFGFFGAITTDSINIRIPEFLINSCGYIDGQD